MPEILLNGPIGRLEARYSHNNVPTSPSVLILHAHPGHGGNMNNPLSLKLHKFFSDIGFSSLRFNFRGVGKSDGEHEGSEGELADSAIALDWLQNQNQESREYWVCGISFGAWVGMQLLMRRPEIPKFILISPPVGEYDFNFLAPCPASGLIISAEKDNLIEKSSVVDVVKKLNRQKSIQVKHENVKSADHFFSNHEQKVIEKVEKYINSS
ncbi:MAG: alpha/beta hydrolase [Pseudomonadota bacterium]|nr:alpha/beta hydrolase [Pseudomonadota bacterium]